MACFLVPMGEAIVTTIVQKVVEKREKKVGGEAAIKTGLSWSRKLSWLNKLLWGGTILLAFEHVWHGEIVPWPPFLTAMENPADVAPMLHEVATIGVGMAVFVTIIWWIIVMIAEAKAKAVLEVKAKPVSGGA
ncbi:MAG: hypothetical protein Q8O43_00265 [Dehalococcoidia bacterium]|nr:hypothetical protein [Dehalococcoidia bacterium]